MTSDLHGDCTKTGPSSTLAGKTVLTGLLAAVLLGGCSTYSEGREAGHDATPHSHDVETAHRDAGESRLRSGDGFAASLNGFTLDVAPPEATREGVAVRFRITGPTGAPQLQYSLDRGKLLHLYLISEDLGDYQHAYPTLDSSGYWSVGLRHPAPGPHRLVISFVARDDDGTERPLVLGTELTLDGSAPQRALPAARRTERAGSIVVTLTGRPVLLTPSALRLEVSRRDSPVPLLPHLGSWAHVTAVERVSHSFAQVTARDVAEPGSSSPRWIDLEMTAMAPGRYRIFVEFATSRGVRQVAFTRTVTG